MTFKIGTHLTNKENFDEIMETNILRAKSPLLSGKLVKLYTNMDYFSDDKYIFALPYPLPSGWKGSEFLQILKKKRSEEVNFLIPQDNCYVMNSQPLYDLTKNIRDSGKPVEEHANTMYTKFCIDKYLFSKTPLKEYKYNFNLPELIINKSIRLYDG